MHVLIDVLSRFLPRIGELRPAGKVAVLRLHGPILGSVRAGEWTDVARRVRESKRFAAAVLDIDSPGGSAAASDTLYLAMQRLAAEKPLVAAISGTGASGAYLAAVAARRIVASPMAIVGSIGVINVSPRLPRLLDRLGVDVSEHTAGALKGMGAPWRPESEAEAEKQRKIVDAIYEQFVSRIAEARRLDPARARELATGEVWLGTEARELGLVDEVGDIERAIEIAAEMADVPPKPARVDIRRPLFGRLIARFATQTALSVADEIELRLWQRFRI